MTTIIAKETSNGVEIGFDSLCSGYDAFELEQKKVFVNNGTIFGVAGRLLIATELKYADLPKAPSDPNAVEKWITARLIPKIRQILNEIAPRRGGDGFNMSILIVVHNKVYEISSDTGWHRRVDGIYTIGSGSPYAYGALHAGKSVAHALLAAKAADPGTGAELYVTTANEMIANA